MSVLIAPIALAEKQTGISKRHKLSIKEAIGVAQDEALKWNKKARLLNAVSLDVENELEKYIGKTGKRKCWNVLFSVPNTRKSLLVTINEDEVHRIKDLTSYDTLPYAKKEFIKLKEITYDSLQLLEKALKLNSLHAGSNYHFILKKDSATNAVLLFIMSWNTEQKTTKVAVFNVTTGKSV